MNELIPISRLLDAPFLKLFGPAPALPDSFRFASLSRQSADSLVWVKTAHHYASVEKGIVILSEELAGQLQETGVMSPQVVHFVTVGSTPRLAFIRLLNAAHNPVIDTTNYAHLHREKGVTVYDGVFIGANVTIGEGTVVYPNVVIHEGVRIGQHCTIRENACIGTFGMGFEQDDSGQWIRFPQIGGLVIGDHVEIGSHSDIKRAALDDTRVGDHCKLGSYVNIGHNCVVGDHALFTVRCIVGGSSVIGRNFFMGMNASIKNGVNVGDNVTLGAHSFLNKEAESNATYIGTPARLVSRKMDA